MEIIFSTTKDTDANDAICPLADCSSCTLWSLYLRTCIQMQMSIGTTTRALCMQCSKSERFISGSRAMVTDVMLAHVMTASEYTPYALDVAADSIGFPVR